MGKKLIAIQKSELKQIQGGEVTRALINRARELELLDDYAKRIRNAMRG